MNILNRYGAIKKNKLSVSSFGSQVSNAGAQGESFLRVGSVLNWKKIMYLSHLEILQHRYTDTNISIERQTMWRSCIYLSLASKDIQTKTDTDVDTYTDRHIMTHRIKHQICKRTLGGLRKFSPEYICFCRIWYYAGYFHLNSTSRKLFDSVRHKSCYIGS